MDTTLRAPRLCPYGGWRLVGFHFCHPHPARHFFKLNIMLDTSFILILCFVTILLVHLWKKSPYQLPPGPRGWPLIGNLLEIPKEYEWLYYATLEQDYGPISSLTVLGKTIIVLNTLEACRDVMEKNSAKCSGRPTLPFAGQMVGWDQQLVMSPYNKHFRLMRKFAHNFLGTKAAAQKYETVQEAEARTFALNASQDSEHFEQHLRTSIGAMVLRMSHGYLVRRDTQDPLTLLIEQSAKDFYIITRPGRWLVDLIPSIKHIPRWVPGAQFKVAAEQYRKRNVEQTDVPYQFVLQSMAEKTALPSMVSQALERGDLSAEEVYALKHVSSAMYGGALDTIISTVSKFLLMMILHPEIQRSIQNELDSVVGTHRLPNLRDKVNLSYFSAVQKEVTRFHPIGPLGIPHEASEDFPYRQYTIPKGSIVIGNIWNIAHNPGIYEDPYNFNPDRFLSNDAALDPEEFVFGFGRRLCPGIEVAQSTIFIVMATCLALFEITRALDVDGKPGVVKPEFTAGTVSHPKPFKCSFKLRSVDALALLRT
ncbi:cytochrome P450 [Crepidotus variabilis]|uniref:Cytochrome P450 n=1 Tax=Crepidotus variabilis TaxID=179855 RepID=A0A9P6JJ13_9AGAR|nr:cytochrome P450 [Crepidotus variabilis]